MSGANFPLFNTLSPDLNVTYDVNYVFPASPEKNYQFRLYEYDLNETDESQCFGESELDQIDMLVLCYQISNNNCQSFLKRAFKDTLKPRWSNVPIILIACSFDKAYFELDQHSTSIMSNLDQELVDEIKPCQVFYCSAEKSFNVEDLFTETFKEVIRQVSNGKETIKENLKIITAKNEFTKTNSTQIRNKHESKILAKSNKTEVSFVKTTKQMILNEHGRSEYALIVRQMNLTGSNISFRSIIGILGLACLILYYIAHVLCPSDKEECICTVDRSLRSMGQSYIHMLNQFIRH